MEIIISILTVIAIIGIPAYIIRLLLDHITNRLADKIVKKLKKQKVMTSQDIIIEHFEAIDNRIGIADSVQKLAAHFGIEKMKDKWIAAKNSISEDDIIASVADFTGISRKEMAITDRKHKRVRARYIVYVEVIRLLKYTQSEAAAIFNQDHATAYTAQQTLSGRDYSSTKYYETYLNTL